MEKKNISLTKSAKAILITLAYLISFIITLWAGIKLGETDVGKWGFLIMLMPAGTLWKLWSDHMDKESL